MKAQFVAVLKLAPLARILRGRISGGYNHGIGPHEAPNAALYIMTNMTTKFLVQLVRRKMKYDMAEREIDMAMAPESKIFLRPKVSTTYHGGIVDKR